MRYLRVCFGRLNNQAGVDSVWEQEKPEARKMPENAAREASHTACPEPVEGSGVSMKAQSDGVAVGHVFGYAPFVE